MFARDAFGFSLGYYHNANVTIGTNTTTHSDYKAINAAKNTAAERFYADITGSDVEANRNNLFNGNIGHMVTTITEPRTYTAAANETPNVLPMGNAYRYDQLNRLVESKSFLNLDPVQGSVTYNAFGFTGTYNNLYYNKFTYDANGNILNQVRHDQTGQVIDDMTYQYSRNNANQIIRNRLYHVNDAQSNTALFDDDIDDMGAFTQADIDLGNTNYAYDEEGRLIKDVQEEIAQIVWRVDGKVSEIIRPTTSTKKNLKFDYDAMGHRIAKHVYSAGNDWEKSTYYVRDAQGNVMSVYERKIEQQPIDQSGLIAAINNSSIPDWQIPDLLNNAAPLGADVLIALINSSRPVWVKNQVLQPSVPLSNSVLLALVNSSMPDYIVSNYLTNQQPLCEDVLLALVNNPPRAGWVIQQVMQASVPLTDAVLIALVNRVPAIPSWQIGQIMSANTLLSQAVWDAINNKVPAYPTWVINQIQNSNAGMQGLPLTNNCNNGIENEPGTTPVLSYVQAERHIYGSSRIGLDITEKEMIGAPVPSATDFERVLGYKQFELAEHRGNVMAVVLDSKVPRDDNQDLTVEYYQPLVISATDYSPFLVRLYGRSFNSSAYRYSGQGQEHDDEVKGEGNSLNFTYRMHDSRLGRFFMVDPLVKDYPHYSSYSFSGNKVVAHVELEGLEEAYIALDGKLYQGPLVPLVEKNKKLVANNKNLLSPSNVKEVNKKILSSNVVLSHGIYAEPTVKTRDGIDVPIVPDTRVELTPIYEAPKYMPVANHEITNTRTPIVSECKNCLSIEEYKQKDAELAFQKRLQLSDPVFSGAYGGANMYEGMFIGAQEAPGLLLPELLLAKAVKFATLEKVSWGAFRSRTAGTFTSHGGKHAMTWASKSYRGYGQTVENWNKIVGILDKSTQALGNIELIDGIVEKMVTDAEEKTK